MTRLIKLMSNHSLERLQKVMRYGLVGMSNTLICLVVMYLGSYIGMHYLQYTILGYLVAVFFSFFMNLYFTFRVKGKIITRLILFLCINLSNIGLVALIEYIMIDVWHSNHILSIISAMLWYIITGFLMNNFFVYHQKL